MAWIDLTEDLTKEGIKRLKVGEVLMFSFEGSPNHIKIMRKRNNKIWGKQVYLYTEAEFQEKLNEA